MSLLFVMVGTDASLAKSLLNMSNSTLDGTNSSCCEYIAEMLQSDDVAVSRVTTLQQMSRIDDAALCLNFLRLTKIADDTAVVTTLNNVTYISSCIGSVRRVHLVAVENMLHIASYKVATGDVIMLVCKDYQHAIELLQFNKRSSLTLMQENVLIVHRSGMMCSLLLQSKLSTNQQTNYGLTCCEKVQSDVVNRRRVLDLCTSPNTAYEYLSGREVAASDVVAEPEHILYYELLEPLDVFGVEYIFTLFRSSRLLCTRVDQLLYIVKSGALVSVAKIS